MRTVEIELTTLASCVEGAQREGVIVTRNRRPVALVIGIEGLDNEQVELGCSDSFWRLIRERRKEPTLSQAEFEERLRELGSSRGRSRIE